MIHKLFKTIIAVLFFLFFYSTSNAQIVLDGDRTDWLSVPTLIISPDNVISQDPIAVPIAEADLVDIKEVKVLISKDTFFVYLQMWGGPIWPNNAEDKMFNDREYYSKSRGYYHICLDLDNNPNTGWDIRYYNSNMSALGYFIQEGWGEYIGCETMIGIGLEYNFPVKNDSSDGVTPYGGVKEITYYAKGYEGDSTYTDEINICRMELNDPDSIKGMAWNGKLPITSSEDSVLLVDSSRTFFAGHAWANGANLYENNFVEFAFELNPIKEFWLRKGKSYLQTDQTIGISAFVETPFYGWNGSMTHDMTTRGEFTLLTALHEEENEIPTNFMLYQNYPNPFNPSTTISYSLPTTSNVRLEVYNLLGQRIELLINTEQNAGNYQVVWNASKLSSGLYFYRLKTEEFLQTKKMMYLK